MCCALITAITRAIVTDLPKSYTVCDLAVECDGCVRSAAMTVGIVGGVRGSAANGVP
ncbi:MAG: hypothetical protein PUK70_05130 [Bacteroidales bacterium]|nr:hypothetical protein [Bacteroidales bacterium]MDY6000880.1 hypothetical protein [Candidatus Cryptobacteroides sp.]